jgi:hypothetical protein
VREPRRRTEPSLLAGPARPCSTWPE